MFCYFRCTFESGHGQIAARYLAPYEENAHLRDCRWDNADIIEILRYRNAAPALLFIVDTALDFGLQIVKISCIVVDRPYHYPNFGDPYFVNSPNNNFQENVVYLGYCAIYSQHILGCKGNGTPAINADYFNECCSLGHLEKGKFIAINPKQITPFHRLKSGTDWLKQQIEGRGIAHYYPPLALESIRAATGLKWELQNKLNKDGTQTYPNTPLCFACHTEDAGFVIEICIYFSQVKNELKDELSYIIIKLV